MLLGVLCIDLKSTLGVKFETDGGGDVISRRSLTSFKAFCRQLG